MAEAKEQLWYDISSLYKIHTCVITIHGLYHFSVDEVLGLKNTNKYTENGTEQNRKMNNGSKIMQASGSSLSVECKNVTEVSARITDADANDTNTVGSTTINLSVVREVTVLKPKNKTNDNIDGEITDDAKDELPSKTYNMAEEYKTQFPTPKHS